MQRKKLTKEGLDELRKSIAKSETMSVIDRNEQSGYVGRWSEGDGSQSNPFSQDYFFSFSEGGWTGGHVEGMGYVPGDVEVIGFHSSNPGTFYHRFDSVADYFSSQSSSSTATFIDQVWNIFTRLPGIGPVLDLASDLFSGSYPERRDSAITDMLTDFMRTDPNTPFVIKVAPFGWGNDNVISIVNARTGEVIDSQRVSTNFFF
ncbi:MAG: hypothetical protein LBI15_03290 [Dysgonamonadaceae bacterium]|jgi:hypothetical protein|nr:hypothetical protein [Dysgonamonadaceae bacterium]